jgi:hypothetical protein
VLCRWRGGTGRGGWRSLVLLTTTGTAIAAITMVVWLGQCGAGKQQPHQRR